MREYRKKLSDQAILEIIDLHINQKISAQEISLMYGVGRSTITRYLVGSGIKPVDHKKIINSNNFWDFIQKGGPDECWPVIKNLDKQGYLKVFFGGKVWTAHSLIYFQKHGGWNPKYEIKHWCDDKTCCNDFHLFVGTPNNAMKRAIQEIYNNAEKNLETGCLIYKGGLNQSGYGQITINNKKYAIHKLAYELENGPIPKGQNVLHTCDTPACFFIDHLWLGTLKDNMDDCVSKGRKSKKLQPEQIDEIKEKYKNGNISQKELGKIYNVDQSTIHYIVANKTWKSLNTKDKSEYRIAS